MIPARKESVKVEQKADDITFLFDLNLLRPACLLFQAVVKADWNRLRSFFPPETWLTNERAAPIRVTGTAEEWRRVVGLARKRRSTEGQE